MRILFAGNPKIAVPSLAATAALGPSGIELVGVLTNPDRPGRRGGKPEPSPVSAAASLLSETRGGLPPIPRFKPERLDCATLDLFADSAPDLLVSFAYGHIFSPEVLARFPLGGINIHPSLLPRHRGATPIQAAILNRDLETGVTIQTLAPEPDHGDILAQEKIPLCGRETTACLSRLAGEKAAVLLSRALPHIRDHGLDGVPQQGEVSYCSRIRKEDGVIDWSLSALQIDARVRAFTPWPLSWTRHKDRRLYVLEAAPVDTKADGPAGAVLGVDRERGILVRTGEGAVFLTRLQYESKKALDFRSFLNGAGDILGAVLG